MVEIAMEMGLAVQEESHSLKKHKGWAVDKIMQLESKLQHHHLKLCKCEEGGPDYKSFLAS